MSNIHDHVVYSPNSLISTIVLHTHGIVTNSKLPKKEGGGNPGYIWFHAISDTSETPVWLWVKICMEIFPMNGFLDLKLGTIIAFLYTFLYRPNKILYL